MYAIEFARDVEQDLRRVPVYYRNIIFDAIEDELRQQPASLSRNRKILVDLVPPWNAEPPIWELRVGNYRVFYDVSEALKKVYVRAVKLKPHGKRTEEIL